MEISWASSSSHAQSSLLFARQIFQDGDVQSIYYSRASVDLEGQSRGWSDSTHDFGLPGLELVLLTVTRVSIHVEAVPALAGADVGSQDVVTDMLTATV